MPVCTKCLQEKSVSEFRTGPRYKKGHSWMCRLCDITRQRLRYYRVSMHRKRHTEILVRLWSRIDCSKGIDSCWLWEGYTNEFGYGEIGADRDGSTMYVHRLAYEMVYGEIPDSMNVLHSCDMPRCCNVLKHLSLGTQAENMQDAVKKGHVKGSTGRRFTNAPQPRIISEQKPLRDTSGVPVNRFWSKVDTSGGPNVCWPWLGGQSEDGHGRFHPTNDTCEGAHRFSYRLHYGEFLSTLKVRHTCNQPSCVNPLHLSLGTVKDNSLDMVQNNRQARNLTANQVRYIRSMKGIISCYELAKTHDVTQGCISAIWNNRTWRHLL